MEEKKEESERYNEKKVVKDFLNSPEGFNALLDKIRRYNNTSEIIEETDTPEKKSLVGCIDEILDFYCAWIKNCPSKALFYKSYYRGFKHIEKICAEKETRELFDYLLKNNFD